MTAFFRNYLVFLLLFVSFSASLQAQGNSSRFTILKQLFNTENSIRITPKEGKTDTVVIAKLRDKHASIPLSRCFYKELSSKVAVLAFEIYLADNADDYKAFINNSSDASVSESSGNKSKLLQVLFYDISANRFIAKPEGFPLEQNYWKPEGMGDMISNYSILKLEKVSNSKTACVFKYQNYLVDAPNEVIVFKLQNGSVIKSKVFNEGEQYNGNCTATIHFSHIAEKASSIICTKSESSECTEPSKANITLLQW